MRRRSTSRVSRSSCARSTTAGKRYLAFRTCSHYLLLHLKDDDLCKLNLLFEDLQVDLMEGRKADPGLMPPARTMSELVATPSVLHFDVRSPCTRLGAKHDVRVSCCCWCFHQRGASVMPCASVSAPRCSGQHVRPRHQPHGHGVHSTNCF